MINFLLWTMPLLGISFPIVIGLSLTLMVIAAIADDDTVGAWILGFIVTMLLLWGIWIGLYHVYPVVF
jgi:hypothetical protein